MRCNELGSILVGSVVGVWMFSVMEKEVVREWSGDKGFVDGWESV